MHIRKLIFTALCMASPIACSVGGGSDTSALSGHHDGGTSSDDCTLTQGYWKNHASAWPVASLKLGTVSYSKAELIAILETPVKGNGLLQLAHQLIAAKLNIAAGASDADVKVAIQQADALIGALVCPPGGSGSLKTSATASLTDKLDAFNSGKIGPGHCGDDHGDHCDGDHCDDDDCQGDEHGDHCDGDHDDDDDHGDGSGSDGGCDQPTPVCGDGVLAGAEACDDGNVAGGDGCSPTCTIEVPVCGNGLIEVGETCDDHNTANGDGCSSTCKIEVPVCGNGIIETGETCDDGNTTNGDGCSSVCICEPCHH